MLLQSNCICVRVVFWCFFGANLRVFFTHGISQPSVSRCIAVVTDALYSIAKDYINFQTSTSNPKFREVRIPFGHRMYFFHMYQ